MISPDYEPLLCFSLRKPYSFSIDFFPRVSNIKHSNISINVTSEQKVLRLSSFDAWSISVEPKTTAVDAPVKSSNAHFVVCFYFLDQLGRSRQAVQNEDFTLARGDEKNVSLHVVN